MSAFSSPNIRTIFDREPTDIFDVCTRVWGIGIPIKRLTRRYAVAIKWRYGNTWVDLALICTPLYNETLRGCFTVGEKKNYKNFLCYTLETIKREKSSSHHAMCPGFFLLRYFIILRIYHGIEYTYHPNP